MVKVTVFDTNDFISRVRSVVLSLEVVVEKYLADIMQKEAKSNINDDFKDTLAQFKASVTARDISGNTKTFPAEVYNILLARHAIKYAPQIENIDGTLIKEMQNYIADILGTDETVVTTDGVYKVSTQFAKSGLSTVTDSNERLYTLTWRNDSAKESLYSLLRSLKSWGQNFQNYFFEQLFKSSPEQIFVKWTTALITCKPSDVRALYKAIKKFAKTQKANDDDSAWTDDDYSNWLSKLTNELFPTTINKEIAALQKKYQTLDDLARDTALLKDYKANANMTVDTIKNTITNLNSYKKFIKAYNDLQTAIGQSASNFDSLIPNYIGYEITNVVSGTFNEDNATITCTNGDNEITIKGNNVKVDTGHGNDYIYNYGSNSTIDANTGDDSIRSQASNVSIQGGDGNDNIETWNSSVTIQGSAGDDSIYSHGSDSSIFGGVGNDEILISGGYADGGTGVDTIAIQGSNVTAYGGGSFDYLPTKDVFNIASGASNISINDFEFGDVLNLPAGSYTARIEFGSTAIRNSNGKLIVWLNNFTDRLENLVYNEDDKKTTDGDDSINNDASNIKIDLGTGNDYAYNSGDNVSIDGGAGNNYVYNSGSNVKIDGDSGDDSIRNEYGDSVSINSGAGNNDIYNSGKNVTINCGMGNDIIENRGYNVKINAGAGNDSVVTDVLSYYGSSNYRSATVNGGEGDDTLKVRDNQTSLNGDAGNDLISVYSSDWENNTLQGGKGNDVIYGGKANTFIYEEGDGNDTIWGFDATSTLKIIGTGYSSVESGSDIIVTGGEGKITLKGAATLSAVHIDGTGSTVAPAPTGPLSLTNYTFHKTINGTSYNDTVWNEGDSVTINAAAGNDSIVNTGDNSSLDIGDGNDYVFNYMGYYVTINGDVGNDSINNIGVSNKIDAGAGNDSIYSFSNYTTIISGTGNDTVSLNSDGGHNVIEYASGDGNDIIYNLGSTDTLKITNGAWFSVANGNDVLVNVDSGTVTLSGAKGKTVNIDGEKLTSIIVDGYTTIETIDFWLCQLVLTGSNINNSKNFTQLIGTDYNDTIKNAGNTIFVNVGSGQDSVYNTGYAMIDAGNGNDTITNYGNYSKIIGGAGNDSIYNRANGVFIYGDAGNDNIYFSGQSSYVLGGADNDSIYVTGSGNHVHTGDGNDTVSLTSSATATTITGGKGDDVINNKGIGQTFLYTAGDGNDLITGFNVSAKLQIADGKGTYSTIKNASDIIITVGEGKITLVGAASLSTVNIVGTKKVENSWKLDGTRAIYGNLITVSGVKSLDGISLSGTTVTVKESSLNKSNVTISDGYTLKLNSVNPPSPIPPHFSGLTFKSASSSEGYSLSTDKKSITYSPAVAESDLFSLTNVKNTDSILVDTIKKTVTLKAANLNKKAVTISDGFTLKLADDVAAPVATKAAWSKVSSGKATYNFASTTAGYKLSNNKVTYTKAVAAKSFTLSGIKSTSGIKVDGTTVTLKAANLNKKAVTISDGLNLKLADDVPTSTTKTVGSFTKFKSGTATFKTTSFSDFYSLKNNQVTYSAASGGKTISIKNLKSSATLDEIKSAISVAEQKNGSCKITFKNADLLTTKAPVISATDVTYTVALDKSLKPASFAPDWKVSGTNASLKSDTSAGYTGSDNKVLYSKKVTGSPQLVLGGLIKNSSLSAPVKKVVTLDSSVLGANSSLKSNDGSYTVKLTGNMSKKTFTGSANADSLNIAANNAAVLGGAGNDSFTVTGSKVTLTGGKGNDSFTLSGKSPVLIYATGDGNDSVNFVAGMHISLSGSTQIKTLGKSGSDLLLGFGKNSSIKVTGSKSSDTLKVSDASGSVTLVAGKFDLANSLTFNSKNSSVAVDKNFTGSLAPSDDIYLGGSKLSGVATINAGNVTSSITITANDKANFISASKNNDEIFGGNGNDSIVGNAGNDKLYGQNGNDSLSGGKGNDSLWGGDGKDVFIYSAGKDFISDYTAGQDKIQIASGKISKTSLSGSDVLFTIGKGALTVKNAKGKTISLIDLAGKTSSTVVGAQTLTNSNKASVTIGADMGFVDASKRTKAISITGNALANTISGGTKNDSIFGAAGNDSILGNAGNDKLYGDAGNDILLGGRRRQRYVHLHRERRHR